MTKPSYAPLCAVITLAFTSVSVLAWTFDDPSAPQIALGAAFAGLITLTAWLYELWKDNHNV